MKMTLLLLVASSSSYGHNVDALLLDQDACQSNYYACNQSPREDRLGDQACPQREADYRDFQPPGRRYGRFCVIAE